MNQRRIFLFLLIIALSLSIFEAREQSLSFKLLMNDFEKRQVLLRFLEQAVFDPILNKPTRSTANATFFLRPKKQFIGPGFRYKERYTTAESVKDAFLADLKSETGAKLATMLQ